MKLSDFTALSRSVHQPAKVALAVTQKPDGGYNLITLEWFMRTSISPVMFAISIGHSRYSKTCLESTRYFNLAFPTIEQQELVKLCGSSSGADIDKFAIGRVECFPGRLHKIPILREAMANLECEIVTQVKSGDHTIYVGEVHYTWIADKTQ